MRERENRMRAKMDLDLSSNVRCAICEEVREVFGGLAARYAALVRRVLEIGYNKLGANSFVR